ncbi:MAG TPA: hypothetical protein VL201_02390 [Patescibacteria group bacterium]|nr:hypothetical protein [Patescibacteria group bacterium]
MKNSSKKYLNNILLLLTCSLISCNGMSGTKNKSILKKRVIEREAKRKVNSVLEQFKSNSMQELVDSLQNMNKLLTTLQVSSVDLAIQKIEIMQNDLQKLLAALGSDSISTAITQAKKVRSVAEQLSLLQTK